MRLAALALLAACNGTVGTVSVTLTTAPGSHVLDPAQTLRLVLTAPHHVQTASRGSSGFIIEIDVPAQEITGSLIVDALDASNAVIATGTSPPFPVNAIDAGVVIYMAAPNSVAAAPLPLSPARSAVATGVLPFGVVLAGGTDAAGAPSDALDIYNGYDHTIAAGLAMPAPRAAPALGVGSSGSIYLFGGADATGAATDNMWRFESSVAPNGAYVDYGEKAGFARTGALAVPIAGDEYLLTGTPAADLSGLDGTVAARTEVTALPDAGTALAASDGVATAMFAGASGVVRFRSGTFDMPAIAAAARAGASVVALPGGQAAVVCGGPDLIEIDAATEAVTTKPAIPSALRTDCAVTATDRHLVIAGGTLGDGTVATTAEIYDATTLALIATQPLVVPRTKAAAIALPNDQILIAGGVDATGAPTETLELFTPASLE